ncbi:hypothetical protein PQQ96_39520, partial [Paraburkholderia sediminicola]|uniref:hypothetical protein n=1 Tax=Paraburkholderia sediminicola TaxID=458836 RepID=UPI0038B95CC5
KGYRQRIAEDMPIGVNTLRHVSWVSDETGLFHIAELYSKKFFGLITVGTIPKQYMQQIRSF